MNCQKVAYNAIVTSGQSQWFKNKFWVFCIGDYCQCDLLNDYLLIWSRPLLLDAPKQFTLLRRTISLSRFVIDHLTPPPPISYFVQFKWPCYVVLHQFIWVFSIDSSDVDHFSLKKNLQQKRWNPLEEGKQSKWSFRQNFRATHPSPWKCGSDGRVAN